MAVTTAYDKTWLLNGRNKKCRDNNFTRGITAKSAMGSLKSTSSRKNIVDGRWSRFLQQSVKTFVCCNWSHIKSLNSRQQLLIDERLSCSQGFGTYWFSLLFCFVAESENESSQVERIQRDASDSLQLIYASARLRCDRICNMLNVQWLMMSLTVGNSWSIDRDAVIKMEPPESHSLTTRLTNLAKCWLNTTSTL